MIYATESTVHSYDAAYAADYVHHALNGDTLEEPNLARLNGYSEPIETLYRAYSKGGQEAVLNAWTTMLEHRPELHQLIAQANRWHLHHVAHLDEIPPITYLFKEEIPARSLTVLYGTSGSGKSFVALDYGLHIAREAAVIYVAPEGLTGYEHRIQAWCQHHKVDKAELDLYFNFEAIPMLDIRDVQSFIDAIRPHSPALVILDPLARCLLGGDENSAKDMGIFIEACASIQREAECAILVVHHTGKSGGTERGSSALRAASDCMIELHNDHAMLSLICSKSKDSKPFPTRHLQLQEVQLKDSCTSCVTVPVEQSTNTQIDEWKPTERHILQVLSTEPFSEVGAAGGTLQQTTSLPESTLYRLLKRLKDDGLIQQIRRGGEYFITAQGKRQLEKFN